MSNTKTIAKNTAWYGLENVINIFVTMFTSIAIARTLGPTKMGDIIYVIWIAGVVANLGSLGIPATMRKYMAEFLGKGDRGTARYVYIQTILLQMGMATIATGAVVIWVLTDAGADYRLAAVLIALSMWPSMVNAISGQANMAAEQLSANLPASISSILVYLIAIAATVVFKWGVLGVGASMLAMRCVDFLVRIIPTAKRILGWESEHIRPEGLQKRMMMFAWQSIITTLIALVVWERSEVFLLKHLCSDIRQVAFYSVAFSLADRLLLSASIFGGAIGSTIFAQYGRDKSRLPALAASAFRYLALTSIPLHFIFTALAVPLLALLYGKAYDGAAAVVTLAPLLCLPKAFMTPINVLLQSMEKQKYLIAATLLAGVVDIGVAWSLIGAHGAVGACIGSGAAQVTAIGMMWAVGIHFLKIKLPWVPLAKITFASIAAALVAHFIAVRLHPILGLLVGGTASLIVLLGLFYILRVLEPADRDRFQIIIRLLPKPLATRVNSLLLLLVPAAPVLSGQNGASFGLAADISTLQAQGRSVTENSEKEGEDLSISVVIPAYNAEQYIRRCLESVFAQTLQPMEVIVVDDGSTDATAALARQLGARVIIKQNGGPAAARNTGINSATGRWVAMLDVDDCWVPEKLERQVAVLRPGAVLVYSGARIFDEDGSR
jgi:O-antigen/teichoic acid export membrane protein